MNELILFLNLVGQLIYIDVCKDERENIWNKILCNKQAFNVFKIWKLNLLIFMWTAFLLSIFYDAIWCDFIIALKNWEIIE